MHANALALLAGAMQVLAFLLYYRTIRANKTQPNASAWFLWVLIGALNASSYYSMPQVDWVKASVAISNALCCAGLATYSLIQGKFRRLSGFEWIVTIIGGVAALSWLGTNSAAVGNGVLQIAYSLSFVPLYVSLWRRPGTEPVLPWLLWSASHVVGIAIVLLTWNGHPLDLLYSCLMIPEDLLVVWLTRRKIVSS